MPLKAFFSMYRADKLGLKQLKSSGRLAWGGEAWALPPVDEAAHIDDSGNRIATRVRTFESIAGRSTVYCSTEQITSDSLGDNSIILTHRWLTWNEQRLTAHYEDDLHRTKATESKFSPLVQSEA